MVPPRPSSSSRTIRPRLRPSSSESRWSISLNTGSTARLLPARAMTCCSRSISCERQKAGELLRSSILELSGMRTWISFMKDAVHYRVSGEYAKGNAGLFDEQQESRQRAEAYLQRHRPSRWSSSAHRAALGRSRGAPRQRGLYRGWPTRGAARGAPQPDLRARVTDSYPAARL